MESAEVRFEALVFDSGRDHIHELVAIGVCHTVARVVSEIVRGTRGIVRAKHGIRLMFTERKQGDEMPRRSVCITGHSRHGNVTCST